MAVYLKKCMEYTVLYVTHRAGIESPGRFIFAILALLVFSLNFAVAGEKMVKAFPDNKPNVVSVAQTGLNDQKIQTKPAVPNGIIASAAESQIAITWLNVDDISSYNLYWVEGKQATVNSPNKLKNIKSPFFLKKLKLGVTYHFVVTSVNDAGESDASGEVVAKTILAPPASPSGLLVSYGDGRNTIEWNTVDGADTYDLRWSLEKKITKDNSFTFDEVSSPFVHKNLDNGVKYYYAVVARNQAGESDVSYVVSSVPKTDKPEEVAPEEPVEVKKTDLELIAKKQQGKTSVSVPPPSSPGGFVVVPGNNQVVFSWKAVDGAITYDLYWSSTAGVSKEKSAVVKNIKPGESHTGLINGSVYYYRLAAVNTGGSGFLSSEVSATPQALTPTSIKDISASLVAHKPAVQLQWRVSPEVEFYNIYWNQSGSVSNKDSRIEKVSSSFMHDKLQSGETYYYLIEAVNQAGSVMSQQLKVVLLPVAPVIDSLAVDKNNQATLSWSLVDKVSSYNMYWSTTSAMYTSINKVSGVKPPYLHSGLLNGKKYYFVVSSINESGESLSSIKSVTVAPDTPVISQIENGDKQANIFLVEPEGAVSYAVYWNNTGNVSKQDQIIRIDSSASIQEAVNQKANDPLVIEHTNIDNGKTYFYRISALNEGGESPLTKEQQITLAPDAPLITGIVVNATSTEISWENVTGVDSYNVYLQTIIDAVADEQSSESKSTGSEKPAGLQLIVSNKPVVSPFTHQNLRKGETYRYIVTAVNEGGESFIRPAKSVILIPEVPSLPSLRAGYKQAAIKWPAVYGATRYQIYWNRQMFDAAKQQMITIAVESSSESLSHVHPNIENGVEYFYQLSAINAGGESNKSPVQRVLLPPDAPVVLPVVEGDETVTVAWRNVKHADSYAIYWGATKGITKRSERVPVVGITYTFVGLKNLNRKYMSIVSINNGGESELSLEATFMSHKRPLANLFSDSRLQSCIENQTKPRGWVYADEVIGNLSCNNLGIKDLEGIEDLIHLRSFALNRNSLEDLTYLSGLTKLKSLSLGSNKISDLKPLTNLTGLTSLRLQRNLISDISPLSSLTRLNYLSLYKNKISDVTVLSRLTLLTSLYLSSNIIVNVTPVSFLLNLNHLDLGRNKIGGKGIGNAASLTSLTHVNKLLIGSNKSMSCSELSALITVLGSLPVDTDGIETNYDVAGEGANCTAP